MHASIWYWEEQSAQQLQELVDSLPSFRREKAWSYKFERDRLLCAKAYGLLRDMLKEVYGISDVPVFTFGPHGKPYLKDSSKFFNLSHCPKGILCAVAEAEVGCDIEEIPPCLDMDLCRLCFNAEEMSRITTASDPTTTFARLWTMKEAYLKLTGEGLTDALPNILSADVLSQVSFSTTVHAEHGCVSTTAVWRDERAPVRV